MAQYIDKAALVAEIEGRRDRIRKGIFSIPLTGRDRAEATFEYELLGKIKELLDTLEVKEVDLEHEVESYWKQCDMTWCRDAYSMTHIRSMLSDIAKHFFELGFAQKGGRL